MTRARAVEWLSIVRPARNNQRMIRRKMPLLPGFALSVLVLAAAGCASTATVVPGKSLALVEVLSNAWGSSRGRDGQRTVWFDVATAG